MPININVKKNWVHFSHEAIFFGYLLFCFRLPGNQYLPLPCRLAEVSTYVRRGYLYCEWQRVTSHPWGFIIGLDANYKPNMIGWRGKEDHWLCIWSRKEQKVLSVTEALVRFSFTIKTGISYSLAVFAGLHYRLCHNDPPILKKKKVLFIRQGIKQGCSIEGGWCYGTCRGVISAVLTVEAKCVPSEDILYFMLDLHEPLFFFFFLRITHMKKCQSREIGVGTKDHAEDHLTLLPPETASYFILTCSPSLCLGCYLFIYTFTQIRLRNIYQ